MGTRIRVYDAAESVKPYVERAMQDEKLRSDLMNAFSTARELYDELIGGRDAVKLATRVATDDDIRDRVRQALEDLRDASDRLQGKSVRRRRKHALLVGGIALGILFNPVTGPETRRFLKDMITGGEVEPLPTSSAGSANGGGTGEPV
jgi:hypothetical protein